MGDGHGAGQTGWGTVLTVLKQDCAACWEMAFLRANVAQVVRWGSVVETSPTIPTLDNDCRDGSPGPEWQDTASS